MFLFFLNIRIVHLMNNKNVSANLLQRFIASINIISSFFFPRRLRSFDVVLVSLWRIPDSICVRDLHFESSAQSIFSVHLKQSLWPLASTCTPLWEQSADEYLRAKDVQLSAKGELERACFCFDIGERALSQRRECCPVKTDKGPIGPHGQQSPICAT